MTVEDELYFPEAVWESREIQFANVGGGDMDDIILPWSREVYINMEEEAAHAGGAVRPLIFLLIRYSVTSLVGVVC